MKLVHQAAAQLRGLADRIDPPPMPPGAVTWEDHTIFERDEIAEANRREAAMSIVDPDTTGYLLLREVRTGEKMAIEIDSLVSAPCWPMMAHTLVEILAEMERL